MSSLTLISHNLCPYVQRAAIALAEKDVPFARRYIDLADKPEWFLQLSPLGKVPVLQVETATGPQTIFESAVLLEYIEETQAHPLHPQAPLTRARHRSWIEFGSSILNRIAAFYNAPTETSLLQEAETLSAMFARLEAELAEGPWFAGDRFSLVDAVFGPVFRYFDTFDAIADFGILRDVQKVSAWRQALSTRRSVRAAVTPDYPERLRAFLAHRGSALSARIAQTA